jgi:hypothetical protein
MSCDLKDLGRYLLGPILGAPLQGRLLALPTNIRLGWKGLPGTNALAYFENSELTAVRSFKTLAPGACTIKLITDVIYGFL